MRTNLLWLLALLLVSGCQCGPDPTQPPVDPTPVDPTPDGGTPPAGVDFLAGISAAREAFRDGATTADLDGDGRQEYRRQLDAQGALLREEIDMDGNGTMDMVWDYSGATKTFRADINGDGIAEETTEVTADESNPERHTFVVTEDSSGDGIPDVRRTYTLDLAEELVELTVEEDPEQDGSFPVGMTYSVPRIQSKHLATVSTSGPGACSPAQKTAIDDAFDKGIKDGLACLAAMNPSLALKYARLLADSNITISCGTDTVCARVDTANASNSWFGKDDLPIIIYPPGFDPAQCGPLESTLFHELSHYAIGLHEIGGGTTDPADRIYGCEKTCFGSATSQTCASCLGSRNDDPRCKRFPPEPCTTPAPAYCPCDGILYPSEVDCNVKCPEGLLCFVFTCDPRGPCR